MIFQENDFLKTYNEIDKLWETHSLQESYIDKLEAVWEKNPRSLCINNLRAGTDEFPFLTDPTFNPYFEYLEQIFKVNGNCRYPIDIERLTGHSAEDLIGLDAHHIIFRSLGGDDSIQNLIALFREEHIQAHTLFVECLNTYIATTENKDQLSKVVAKATKSIYILNKDKQGQLSTDQILQVLKKCLEQEGLAEDNLNTENLITKINNLNYAYHLAVVNRTTHGGEENLKLSEKDLYEVSFLNPNEVVRVSGIAGVQEIIYERTGKSISKDGVKNRTTTIKHKENKQPPLNRRDRPVSEKSFTDFNLQYPYGIYRITDTRNQTKHRESTPIIYFPIDTNLVVDYSKGQWIKSPNALKTAGIGNPDKAYERLDKVHSFLEAGALPIVATFKGKESDNYIFMYASDIKLLQKVIDNENSKRSPKDQLTLRVMKDNEVWYPVQKRLVAALEKPVKAY